MRNRFIIFFLILIPFSAFNQDLSQGLQVNDLNLYPMQEVAKPNYLESFVDPSFGTTIRRITDAGTNNIIVPMYSTIQAWNADESLMIVYDVTNSTHLLLNGMNYQFIRNLDDFWPADIEQIFWDFNDPDIFYYPNSQTDDFIKYTVSTQAKEIIVNPAQISNCNGSIHMGNDIQMMSWDSDVFCFRCDNESGFSYRISTETLTTFDINDMQNTAPTVAPSGEIFYHDSKAYDASGAYVFDLNEDTTEHSCIGKLANGNDGHFAIAFAQGPQGGCIGDIVAHDLTTENCFPVTSQSQGYDYSQSGTHISAIAHKNTEGGWLAASMIGFEKDGQSLLDQELVIAKVEEGNIKVCRIGHHRSDEDEIDYWGEPHAVISPTGTRVLFASDWSGAEDGKSIDAYVVELPAFENTTSSNNNLFTRNNFTIFPNPITENSVINFDNPNQENFNIAIFNLNGRRIIEENISSNTYKINHQLFQSGIYFFYLKNNEGTEIRGKFIVQ